MHHFFGRKLRLCHCDAAATLNAQGEELKCSIIADALKKNKLAFGFSAGGLLFPYYIGVIDQLEELGVLTGAFASSSIIPKCDNVQSADDRVYKG